MDESRARVEHALLRRACALFGVGEDGALADGRAVQLTWSELRLGDRALESLDLVELLVTVGEELDLELIDMVDVEAIESVAGVARVVVRDGSPDLVGGFCERWAPA